MNWMMSTTIFEIYNDVENEIWMLQQHLKYTGSMTLKATFELYKRVFNKIWTNNNANNDANNNEANCFKAFIT